MALYDSQSNAGSGSLTGGLKVATPKIPKKEKEKKTDWLGLAAEIAGGAAGAGLGFAVGGPVGASIGAGVGMKGGQMGGIAANKAAGLEGKVERTPYTELASAAVGGALRSEGLYEGFDEAEAATEALDARMTQGGLAGTPTPAPSPTPKPAVPTSAKDVNLGPGQVAGLTDDFIASEQARHQAELMRQNAAEKLLREQNAARTIQSNQEKQELLDLGYVPSRFEAPQTMVGGGSFLPGPGGGEQYAPATRLPRNRPAPETPLLNDFGQGVMRPGAQYSDAARNEQRRSDYLATLSPDDRAKFFAQESEADRLLNMPMGYESPEAKRERIRRATMLGEQVLDNPDWYRGL
tara:strand:+ start:3250 stop:4299 length:1050 start_codon:yes stop_codon:yes gene_type:complete